MRAHPQVGRRQRHIKPHHSNSLHGSIMNHRDALGHCSENISMEYALHAKRGEKHDDAPLDPEGQTAYTVTLLRFSAT